MTNRADKRGLKSGLTLTRALGLISESEAVSNGVPLAFGVASEHESRLQLIGIPTTRRTPFFVTTGKANQI
jgi:hypothetical protein